MTVATLHSIERRRWPLVRMPLAAAAIAWVVGAHVSFAEDRILLRPGTSVATEAAPRISSKGKPRLPELRGSIVETSPDSITIDTPTHPTKKQWRVAIDDVLDMLPNGEPEEMRDARGLVLRGDGLAARTQLEPLMTADRRIERDSLSDTVRDELAFVDAASRVTAAMQTGEGLPEALTATRDYLASHPRSIHAVRMQEWRGDLLVRLGRFDEAVEAYAAIGDRSAARQIRVARLTGEARRAQRRLDDAAADFTRATTIACDEGDLSALLEKRLAVLGLARCRIDQGKPEEAITVVRAMLAQPAPEGSSLGSAYNVLGTAQRATDGHGRDAIISFLTVDLVHHGVREEHAEALFNLVELWNQANHPERARATRQTLETAYPESPWARKLTAAPPS